MAGHARFTAVLDACVLYPVGVADALISLAVAGLYAAKWTAAIEDEWIRNLELTRPELQGRLSRRRDDMRTAVPDWEVPVGAWQTLAPCLSLPDPGDVHVLAAAIAGHADCIVTTNLRHFPDDLLRPYGIEAIHPDDFMVAQLDLDEFTALAAFRDMRTRKKNPALNAEEFAEALERNGLVATASRLRAAAPVI
ncbi:MAG TPA: PIN domain-containing protein [Methylibium sp.]|nr:PIN domain-containing protein [Methylibium sp.]